MLFVDDTVLLAETSDKVNARLQRVSLEGKKLQISRSKTKYLRWNFSEELDMGEPQVTFGGDILHKRPNLNIWDQ